MRDLSGALLTALQQQTGERIYAVELAYSGGTLRLTTGPQDLSWDGHTWDACGGALSIGPVEESGDMKGSGFDLQLSGVDQTVTGILLGNQYRGRVLKTWQIVLNQSTGAIIGAIPLFDGLQLDNYEIEERVDRGQLSCIIRTRGRQRLSVAEFRGIFANVHAHQRYYTGDTFFKHVPSIPDKKFYWGTTAPTEPRGWRRWGHPGGGGGGGIVTVPPPEPKTPEDYRVT